MTPEQREEFERRGVLRLAGALGGDVVGGIRERVWEQAERGQGVRRGEPSSWRRVRPSLMKPLAARGLFEPLLGPVPGAALDALLGAGCWHRPASPGQLLMTPPDAREWFVPHQVWHLDLPAPGSARGVPGAQLFLLLDRVGPHDGSTLVVAGSSRLVEALPERADPAWAGRSAEVRCALRRRVPWLRALWTAGPREERLARFVDAEGEHDGVPLRVVPLAGDAGDVFVTHLWTLHAPSPNAGARMRMAVTERLRARAPVTP